jgi:hypothetical protein
MQLYTSDDFPPQDTHLVATGSINAGVRSLAVEGMKHPQRKHTHHRQAVHADRGHLCSASPASFPRASCVTTAVSCNTRALKSGANVHIKGARASFGGLARATEKTMHQGSPERGEESERGPLSSTLNQLLSSAPRQTCSDGTHPVPRSKEPKIKIDLFWVPSLFSRVQGLQKLVSTIPTHPPLQESK